VPSIISPQPTIHRVSFTTESTEGAGGSGATGILSNDIAIARGASRVYRGMGPAFTRAATFAESGIATRLTLMVSPNNVMLIITESGTMESGTMESGAENAFCAKSEIVKNNRNPVNTALMPHTIDIS
jgi:hypothetical protein